MKKEQLIVREPSRLAVLEDGLYEGYYSGYQIRIPNFYNTTYNHELTILIEDGIRGISYDYFLKEGDRFYLIKEVADPMSVIGKNVIVRTLSFYKEENGRWYVNLPEWEGDKAELEMVAGADMMLDIYSQFEDMITLTMSNGPLRNGDVLEFIDNPNIDSGADYKIKTLFQQEYNFDIWLCDVTKVVFGKFPEKIYIRR